MLLYVGLGANIGDREKNIKTAVKALGERIGAPVGCSSFFVTRPVGFISENMFLNAVAVFETELSPTELLAATQDVERRMGRTIKSAGGVYTDRVIDIDLLLLGNTIVKTDKLILPHPLLQERRFVLEPLHELAPELKHPLRGQTVTEMLRNLNKADIRLLSVEECPTATEAVNRLLPQLSQQATPLTATDLYRLVKNETTYVYIVRDETANICGMATLCLCASPTGVKAWIEDVVVDETCRERGYARQLIETLKSEATHLQAKSLNLTSRPLRTAANALYRNAGFALRDTNVYRLQTDL